MSEKVFNHTAHKELWNWLSINTDQVKANWPGWSYNGGVMTLDEVLRNKNADGKPYLCDIEEWLGVELSYKDLCNLQDKLSIMQRSLCQKKYQEPILIT